MTLPWRTGTALSAAEYASLRRRAMFDCCKWDPQVADTPSLCDFPLILMPSAWSEVASIAEQLGRETLLAEGELIARPALHRSLGLPSSLRSALQRRAAPQEPAPPRVMRFDFHYTRDGWKISEVNSDVPGGFIEASPLTRLVAEHYPGVRPTGDPAHDYVDALRRHLRDGQAVALVHATAYVDDRQVMVYLGQLLAQSGIQSCLASPEDVRWNRGQAWVIRPDRAQRVASVVRFYPAEWLPNLERRTGWQHFFSGSRTPLSNPGTAILTQSKRFPLIWKELNTPLCSWRTRLPTTCDPREVHWHQDPGWVLKPALGRVGESIGLRGVTDAKEWRSISRNARWWPNHWVAQQRFEAVPIRHDDQMYYPVLGVYVIDGRASGIYGRLARRPLIDHHAQDIAVLVEAEPRTNSDE